ncbi:MAG: molybdopterin molybdenumtransferase MoeA, partial [Selenomonas sp.]|nr:molybdopterin molybdenumtransferase MoeA [Selenomonas sp.]
MQNLSLEKAIDVLKRASQPVRAVVEVELLQALGLVLAEDYAAAADNPPFDRSSLDGYAFRAESTAGATADRPAVFTIVGEACAGTFYAESVPKGAA